MQMMGDPPGAFTPSEPPCGYCAMCGALRYRSANGIICSSGCKVITTPVPDSGTSVPKEGTMPLVEHPGAPDVPAKHAAHLAVVVEEASYVTPAILEELEQAADACKRAAEHIRRGL